MILRRDVAEIERERVKLSDAGGVEGKAGWICMVHGSEAGGNVNVVIVKCVDRVNFLGRAEEPEFRVGRRLEFIVRVDLHPTWMIERDELHLIEVRDLMQLFGDIE